jgi:hypothetical protein
LGLPATSGREAMEVEGNILPVDLRIGITVTLARYHTPHFIS